MFRDACFLSREQRGRRLGVATWVLDEHKVMLNHGAARASDSEGAVFVVLIMLLLVLGNLSFSY